MINRFGVILDRNHYAPSIVGRGDCCYLCGKNGFGEKLDRHEIFGGANREKSKELGLWVKLCHCTCHLDGAHKDAAISRRLKKDAQQAAMTTYGWTKEQFIDEFGESYL